MACWELVPFTSDLQVTYGGLFTFCYWFMFFQKGEIPPVDFDCFPVCLSPPTPPPSSIWFRLICPEVSGTKEVVGFFFTAKQKVDYFSRKVQADSHYVTVNPCFQTLLCIQAVTAAMSSHVTRTNSSSCMYCMQQPETSQWKPFYPCLWSHSHCGFPKLKQDSWSYGPALQTQNLHRPSKKDKGVVVFTGWRKKTEASFLSKESKAGLKLPQDFLNLRGSACNGRDNQW